MSLIIDHNLPWNPKWKALTPQQRVTLIETWCWIDQYEMDGHIPTQVLADLKLTGPTLKALTTPLISGKAAWLDETDHGYYAHDWDDINPPSDPDERAAWHNRNRQKRSRGRNGKRNAESNANSNGHVTPGVTETVTALTRARDPNPNPVNKT